MLRGIPFSRAGWPWCGFGLALRPGSGGGVPAGGSSRRVWGAGQQVGADGTLWGRSCGHPRVLLVAGSPVILHSLCLELYMFGGFFFWAAAGGGKQKATVPHGVRSGSLPGYGRDIPRSLEKRVLLSVFRLLTAILCNTCGVVLGRGFPPGVGLPSPPLCSTVGSGMVMPQDPRSSLPLHGKPPPPPRKNRKSILIVRCDMDRLLCAISRG